MSQAVGTRRVVRSVSDRWVGGVAGGLAEHVGAPAWVLRLGFVVTTLVGGVGLVAYLLMWVFLPLDPSQPADAASTRRPTTGWDLTGVLGLLALGLGVLLGLAALGLPIRVSVWGPVLIVGAGVVLLWRQSDDLQRDSIRSRAEQGLQVTGAAWDRQGWIRVLVGLGLVLLGLVAVVGPQLDLITTGQSLAAAGAVVAGVVLIALPWISTWIKRLEAERYAAARAEERAMMAARVHDSVLQTLTLIQRRADDPVEVARLARSEERALRSWLYAPAGPRGSLGAVLAEVVATAEADYDARIELVTVGDAVVDDRLAALVAATREAVVNAAKHAGAPASVYAEVGEGQVEVNVRDRGCGFDLGAVDPDRHGVRQSIIDRMGPRCAAPRGRAPRSASCCRRRVRPVADDVPGDPTRTHLPRVVLVDDHGLFRAGVAHELSGSVELVGEAGDVEKAIIVIRATRPDVVLLDVHLPGGGGRAILDACVPELPGTRFLALSVSDAADDVIGVVRGGARGYVTKGVTADELLDAIHRVAAGEAVFSPRLAGFVLDAFSGAAPVSDELDQLSPREREVMRFIARGYTYREIARELVLSVKTVETHVSSVLRKLQLSNRHELARWAQARGVV